MSSELLEDLRATTRQALSSGSAEDVVNQLDLMGLLIDENHGGLGLGDREMVLVGEELGRSRSPSSFLPTVVLAATLLTHGDADATSGLLSSLPQTRYAVAVAGPDGSWFSAPSAVTAARSSGGDWLLSGTAWGLTTPATPERLLTAAGTGDGAALFVAELDQVALRPADELDPLRGLVEVVLDRTSARLVASAGVAPDALRAAHRRALLAAGAEQLGVARACLEMTVEYAKTRNQFGAPIGSFQAIKHRCAEMLLDVELADAVLQQAAEHGVPDDAELAFILTTRAAVAAAESCIHIHGGIGFTWEHSAHWYLRRARVNATLLGSPGLHRNAIAKSVGLTAPVPTEGY